MMNDRLAIVDVHGVELHPRAIATPLLLSLGGGEAYFVPTDRPDDADRMPGVWYLFEPPIHVAPDGAYVQVRVTRVTTR